MKISKIIVALLLLVTSAASAREPPKSFGQLSEISNQTWHRCQDEANTSSIARARCSAQHLDRQSELLDRAMATARAKLNKKMRERLASSHQRWEQWIYRKCRFAELALQTGAGMDDIDQAKFCLAGEVSDRILWLERRYSLRR